MFIERHLARDLVLPDGRHAETLRLTELRKTLEALKIPGIEPNMTKPEFLEAYRQAFIPALADVRRNLPANQAAAWGKEFNTKLLARAAQQVRQTWQGA